MSGGHQGPQPISPPPLPPQISAAELSMLTEASATKNGTFQCTLCNKQFGYKNGLIRHVRLTHVGEKPYQCNICNRRFGYKHILMEHQNLHFGNRPYACNLCDKRFAARSNLIQHRMVHKRPFNCSLCNKRFDREDQLKKHLFAHPQSLLMCTVCKFTGSSQVDIQRHMLEAHHLQKDFGMSPPPGAFPGSEEDMAGGQMDAMTTPDSSDDHYKTAASSAAAASRFHGITDSRGHRIDAICSQLSTSVASSFFHPQQQPGPYHGVVVKKEMVDTTEGFGGGAGARPDKDERTSPRLTLASEAGDVRHYHPVPVASSGGLGGGGGFSSDPFLWSSHISRYPLPGGAGPGSSSSFPAADLTKSSDEKQHTSALPGIHEVFSRRGQKLPSFANFMPVPMKVNLPLPDLTLSMLQSPPAPPASYSSSAAAAALSGVTVNPPTQRPTAQLPPITHTMRQTKDQASQHNLSIAGFPSLDDVLSYYISQGRLFKCQHCNILFFERGMYFLHASLHGLTSPWECSICHKVCSDKNEFTLHFVNQQHNS